MRGAGFRAFWVLVGLWLLSIFGCATLPGPLPQPRVGQEQAVWIIWTSYGRTDTPPLVRWVEGAALSCTDPDSGKPGFPQVEPGGLDQPLKQVCHEGQTWSPLEVLVSWHGELSFSETALAHEMAHADLLRRGVWEGHHDRPDFYTRIEAANKLVREAGR